MENCKVVIQKRWSQSLKGGAGYTLYPSACLRGKKGQWRHQNYLIIKDKRKTERKSSRLIDAKRLFQEIKSVSFFHISAVLVRTGVCAYIDGTLLLILFKRYEVSTVEIHLDSVDNFSAKKNGRKASFKNDQRKWQETLKSCKVVKSTFMVRA